MSVPPPTGINVTAILDSLARVHLLQGSADSCSDVLDKIEGSVQAEQDRVSYEQRYGAFTRIQLLARLGHVDEALAKSEELLERIVRAGDGLLQKQVQLTKADLLQRTGRTQASMALLAEVVPTLVGVSPELYGRSEQILACALATARETSAEAHRDRASRVYEGLGSVPRQRDLAFAWNEARKKSLGIPHRTDN